MDGENRLIIGQGDFNIKHYQPSTKLRTGQLKRQEEKMPVHWREEPWETDGNYDRKSKKECSNSVPQREQRLCFSKNGL